MIPATAQECADIIAKLRPVALLNCLSCGATVVEYSLGSHIRNNTKCRLFYRTKHLSEVGLIACASQSPLYKWLLAEGLSTPAMVDMDVSGELAGMPLWLVELWFQESKAGRSDPRCSFSQWDLHAKVREALRNDKRRSALDVSAKLRGIGYISNNGSILTADKTTFILDNDIAKWQPQER